MLRIAQLSDTHLDGSPERTARLRRAIDWIEGLAPAVDLIVVTGDLTHHGTADEYALARAALGTHLPMVALPGNHDRRGPFRAVLLADSRAPGAVSPAARAAHADSEINQLRLLPGLTVACLDSTVPGSDSGALTRRTLSWLEKVLLTHAGQPALVALHHPPVALGLGRIDDLRLADAEPLEAVLARHPEVVGLICGHVHAAAGTVFAGVPLWAAPAIAFGAHLPGEPAGGSDAVGAPAVTVHVLDDSGRLTTQLRTL